MNFDYLVPFADIRVHAKIATFQSCRWAAAFKAQLAAGSIFTASHTSKVLWHSRRMTELELKQEAPAQQRFWWVWIAWLNRESGGGFVYGCAARSFRTAGWRDDCSIELPDGKLVISQCLVAEDVFDIFRNALDAGVVSFDALLASAPPSSNVAAKRAVIQDCLGHAAARATLYYTLPDINTLIGPAEPALERVLSALQGELNLPFKGAYAARLGNFEMFDLHPWLDGPRPFLIEVKRDPSKERTGPQIMEICRTPAFACVPHIAHLVGRVNDNVVIDRLITLPAGDLRVPVSVPEQLDQFDFRLFDERGETVLHSERSSFLNRIGLVMAPIGRQINLGDDLSARAKQKGRALGAQASAVVSTSPERSLIGGPATGSWRKFAEDMEDIINARLPKSGEDKWFARGIEGEVGAISHLNHLLNGGHIRSAVLVDPWFGVEAVNEFTLRLSSQNMHLTIVTGWTTVDPDTNGPLAFESDPTAKLAAALRQIQPFLNPRLTLINLVDGKSQAFHDRYLLIYPHEGVPKVFLLSNSLNKMAGNWPFSMSLFAPDVGREVQHYIEGLCDGRDTARGRPLTVTFRWPSNGG